MWLCGLKANKHSVTARPPRLVLQCSVPFFLPSCGLVVTPLASKGLPWGSEVPQHDVLPSSSQKPMEGSRHPHFSE